MKKILIVATGGTIGSSLREGCRRLAPHVAQSTLMENYLREGGTRAAEDFFDSHLEEKTLSENMTVEKQMKIAEHIRTFDTKDFSGIVLLHGTDTLDFSAALFSLLFCHTEIPIILVSGNRPPEDVKSNATANFSAAVRLIEKGIAPNVYVTYRNSDGITRLYLGSSLLGCGEFSEDFLAADGKGVFSLDKNYLPSKENMEKIEKISEQRPSQLGPMMENIHTLHRNVLLLRPYVGLDYSKISLDGVDGVLHGTYHSGTLCVDGGEEKYTALSLARRCKEKGIPFYLAPCKLDENQYETAFAAAENGIIPLYTNTVTAYYKLLIALSADLHGDELSRFMSQPINN